MNIPLIICLFIVILLLLFVLDNTKKIDIKTESLVGFEIFLDNLKLPKKTLKDQKTKFEVSDYQKSERDFAFVVDKVALGPINVLFAERPK